MVVSFANHTPKGNMVGEFFASVVGKPARMHMLLGRPVVVTVEAL